MFLQIIGTRLVLLFALTFGLCLFLLPFSMFSIFIFFVCSKIFMFLSFEVCFWVFLGILKEILLIFGGVLWNLVKEEMGQAKDFQSNKRKAHKTFPKLYEKSNFVKLSGIFIWKKDFLLRIKDNKTTRLEKSKWKNFSFFLEKPRKEK